MVATAHRTGRGTACDGRGVCDEPHRPIAGHRAARHWQLPIGYTFATGHRRNGARPARPAAVYAGRQPIPGSGPGIAVLTAPGVHPALTPVTPKYHCPRCRSQATPKPESDPIISRPGRGPRHPGSRRPAAEDRARLGRGHSTLYSRGPDNRSIGTRRGFGGLATGPPVR
jgi:hypothetical protein